MLISSLPLEEELVSAALVPFEEGKSAKGGKVWRQRRFAKNVG